MRKDEIAIDVYELAVEAFQRIRTELRSCIVNGTAGSVWCGLPVEEFSDILKLSLCRIVFILCQ